MPTDSSPPVASAERKKAVQWKLPREWDYSLWEREPHPGQGPHAGWEPVLRHAKCFVERTCMLLARLQPQLEFIVCAPGVTPLRKPTG